MSRFDFRPQLLAVLLGTLLPAAALAETTKCTVINSVPATISTSGVYCLNGNISTALASGDAITISASNVVFDLNGHVLDNTAAGSGTQTTGISITGHNVVVKNGTVRAFLQGLRVTSSANPPSSDTTGTVVEELAVESSVWTGIRVTSSGNIIRGSKITNSGWATGQNGLGITVGGDGNRIVANDVSDTSGTDSAIAIGVSGSGSRDIIEGNRIWNRVYVTNSFGIYSGGGVDTIVSDNRITYFQYGVYFETYSSGKYRNNLTSGVTVPFTGGTDAGNNN